MKIADIRTPELKIKEQDCFEFLNKYKDKIWFITLSCGTLHQTRLELTLKKEVTLEEFTYTFFIKDNILKLDHMFMPYDDAEVEGWDFLVYTLKILGSCEVSENREKNHNILKTWKENK